MMYTFIWFWTLVGLLLILVAATSKYKLVSLLAPPMILLLTIMTIYWEYSMLNEPIHSRPIGEYFYQHHKITKLDDKQYIYVWLTDKERKEKMFFFEYNKQDESGLRKAKQKSSGKEGKEQKVTFKHNRPLMNQDIVDREVNSQDKND